MTQKIRIKLKSYDHNLVDKSAEKIVKTVKSTGAVISGPVPLPTHQRIYTVLRSLAHARSSFVIGVIQQELLGSPAGSHLTGGP